MSLARAVPPASCIVPGESGILAVAPAPGGDADWRCEEGHLLATVRGGRIYIRCRSCKQVHVFQVTGLAPAR